MNYFSFIDIFLFFFILQFIFYFNFRILWSLVSIFFSFLSGVFTYRVRMPLSYIFSFFVFVFLLVCCFFGYFCYSFCPCGMIEFTFVFALVCWIRTFLTFISGEKFSVYMRKSGDGFFKTFIMFLVEFVSEFSRPISLTVRLTVNISVGHLISMSLFMLIDFIGRKFFFLYIFAILLECFVFFIQSYIFSRLIFLYLNE